MAWSERVRLVLLPVLAVALIGGTSPQTTPLSPSATVTSVCTIASPAALAFGPYDPVVTNNTTSMPLDVALNALSVSCTRGAPGVTIGLGASGNAASCPSPSGQRCLVSSGHVLNYQIYTTAGRGTIWDSANTLSHSSTSMAATLIPVYGRIPGGQDATIGASYADSVTATVNF
jgi:spore coat protein U-like protein